MAESAGEGRDKGSFSCSFPKGALIFNEGDEGNLVYFIQSGKVQIVKEVGTADRVLADLEPGDFFGEMALITDKPRFAAARAGDDVQLEGMSRDFFFKRLRSDYDMAITVMEQLASRLAEADRKLELLLFADATIRFVKLLEGGSGSLSMGIGQIAFEMGIPEERVQRIIEKFQEKGIVKVEGDDITLLDRDKMNKIKNYLVLKDEFGQME